jgi:hypothetical protein
MKRVRLSKSVQYRLANSPADIQEAMLDALLYLQYNPTIGKRLTPKRDTMVVTCPLWRSMFLIIYFRVRGDEIQVTRFSISAVM